MVALAPFRVKNSMSRFIYLKKKTWEIQVEMRHKGAIEACG